MITSGTADERPGSATSRDHGRSSRVRGLLIIDRRRPRKRARGPSSWPARPGEPGEGPLITAPGSPPLGSGQPCPPDTVPSRPPGSSATSTTSAPVAATQLVGGRVEHRPRGASRRPHAVEGRARRVRRGRHRRHQTDRRHAPDREAALLPHERARLFSTAHRPAPDTASRRPTATSPTPAPSQRHRSRGAGTPATSRSARPRTPAPRRPRPRSGSTRAARAGPAPRARASPGPRPPGRHCAPSPWPPHPRPGRRRDPHPGGEVLAQRSPRRPEVDPSTSAGSPARAAPWRVFSTDAVSTSTTSSPGRRRGRLVVVPSAPTPGGCPTPPAAPCPGSCRRGSAWPTAATQTVASSARARTAAPTGRACRAGAPGGRKQGRRGPGVGERPEQLGEADVIAGRQAQSDAVHVHHGGRRPRRDGLGLGEAERVVEVDLVVGGVDPAARRRAACSSPGRRRWG